MVTEVFNHYLFFRLNKIFVSGVGHVFESHVFDGHNILKMFYSNSSMIENIFVKKVICTNNFSSMSRVFESYYN